MPGFGEYTHLTYGSGEMAKTKTHVEWTGNDGPFDWSSWRWVKIQPMTIDSLAISPEEASVTLDGTVCETASFTVAVAATVGEDKGVVLPVGSRMTLPGA